MHLASWPATVAGSSPYTLEALQEFNDRFDLEMCCQDHVLIRILLELESRINSHMRGHAPQQSLALCLVGGTGTGKSHTLDQLATTVFKGRTFQYSMMAQMTAREDIELVAAIKLHVKQQPASLIVIESAELALGSRTMRLLTHAAHPGTRGKIDGVDFGRATLAFTFNSPDTSQYLEGILRARAMKVGLSGSRAYVDWPIRDWAPAAEELLRTVVAPKLGFEDSADVLLLPFWPLDDECLACAARRQFSAVSKIQVDEGRMKGLTIDPQLFAQIAQCQQHDDYVSYGRFATFGAKHVETTFGACLNSIGSKYNPATKTWKTTYKWSTEFVDIAALDPTDSKGAKCVNTRFASMCQARARSFKFQLPRRTEL